MPSSYSLLIYKHLVLPYKLSTPLYHLCSFICPVLVYIYPLLACIVFVFPYIPVPFYIYPLLSCIVVVLPYIPVSFYTTLYSLVSSLYPHISLYPSTSTLYSLVSSLYSYISPYPSTLPSTLLYSLCTPIYPLTFYIYPLLPCIVFVFPYIPLPF